MVDKQQLSDQFASRLRELIARRGENLSRFATRIGVDRSALSQFFGSNTLRLPRAETLCTIAQAEHVSLDWLMGLSQSEGKATEVAPILDIEQAEFPGQETRLVEWHREALGYKIRHVPASLPDLVRTEAVTRHLYGRNRSNIMEARSHSAQHQLVYSRRPETDMEICMPKQTLITFANGTGIWQSLAPGARVAQLNHMADLLDELYPTLRLFLYDLAHTYSAPFTVFGPVRAAIFIGELYLVVNSVDHIRQLGQRFDQLIRLAEINPGGAVEFVRGLKV